jgi:glutamine amidotransferase|tara:strand:+ start:233 stop:865 length:633 start_codon:yes stop_codon:yes gene_type:complete
MIVIVDYGMGNLRSVQKGFEAAGHKAEVSSDPEVVGNAAAIVLPGVGAFQNCMRNLEKLDLVSPIKHCVNSKKPFLGICLGLQLLFSESEEFGNCKGLDLVPGKVCRFPKDLRSSQNGFDKLKIPHMGWNTISKRKAVPLLKDAGKYSFFYFVHSYYVVPEDEEIIATITNYGIEFVSGIHRENLFAFQFHPEKSQKLGLTILKNFGDML